MLYTAAVVRYSGFLTVLGTFQIYLVSELAVLAAQPDSSGFMTGHAAADSVVGFASGTDTNIFLRFVCTGAAFFLKFIVFHR